MIKPSLEKTCVPKIFIGPSKLKYQHSFQYIFEILLKNTAYI